MSMSQINTDIWTDKIFPKPTFIHSMQEFGWSFEFPERSILVLLLFFFFLPFAGGKKEQA